VGQAQSTSIARSLTRTLPGVQSAQCFRDLGEAGHAARYARRSLDMDRRYVRDIARRLRHRVSVPAVRDFTNEVRDRLPAAAGRAAPR
jgi:hypothetical protein